MKNTPVEAGRFAFFSPLPMLFASGLWSWIVVFGIYFGLLQLDVPIPEWLIGITIIPPVFCSPILGILGIVHGIIKRKEKRAWLGILLSTLCLVENALLFCAMGYLSRFQHRQNTCQKRSGIERFQTAFYVAAFMRTGKYFKISVEIKGILLYNLCQTSRFSISLLCSIKLTHTRDCLITSWLQVNFCVMPNRLDGYGFQPDSKNGEVLK